MSQSNIRLIATAPHTFHGAGTIKSRILHALHGVGFDVHFVGLGRPHFFKTHDGDSFRAHEVKIPESEAYSAHAKTFWSTYAIAEKVAELAIAGETEGFRVVFWGTYLHPYVQALCLANDYLSQAGYARNPIVSFPAGSDIWESGSSVARSVRWLLDSQQISVRATYSKKFVREIRWRYGVRGGFEVLPPLLDRSDFPGYSQSQRQDAKLKAGIQPGTMVVLHHSNLRPVKRVQDTIELVKRAAAVCNSEVLLVIVGPNDIHAKPVDHCQYELFQRAFPASRGRNLTIVNVGIEADVRRYLRIADIAVNTSVHDSFNVSLLEAAWSGAACVTSPAPAIASYFKAGKCAQLLSYVPGARFLDVASQIDRRESPFDLARGAIALAELLDNNSARESLAMSADAYLVPDRKVHVLKLFATLPSL